MKTKLIPFTLENARKGWKIVQKHSPDTRYKFGSVSPDKKIISVWMGMGNNWYSHTITADDLEFFQLEEPIPDEPRLSDEEIEKMNPYDKEELLNAHNLWKHGANAIRDFYEKLNK